MQVPSRIEPVSRTHAVLEECPEPLSLETLAVVQQVLAEVLQGLRQRAAPQAAREAGAIEYASWLQHLH